MLARLSKIPGVASAQVDATGQHFVLLPKEEADTEIAVDQALQILGTKSRHLQGPEFESLVMNFDLEEIWLSTNNIRSLSLLETRILANRWGGSAATDAGLSSDLALHLSDLLRIELVKEFDRVHAKGGTSERDWYKTAFPAAFERAIARMEMISPSQANSLGASLLRCLNE